MLTSNSALFSPMRFDNLKKKVCRKKEILMESSTEMLIMECFGNFNLASQRTLCIELISAGAIAGCCGVFPLCKPFAVVRALQW